MPYVSVLIPARNASETIDACLRSLCRQSLTDWEGVIVDDGSTDSTAETVGRWAVADSRVRVVRPAGQGIVAALNEGLGHCGGAWVARMDADDVMHRRRLECQAGALAADPTSAAVGCHVRMFPRAALTPGMRAYEAWLNSLASSEDVSRDAFVECPIAHPTLMIRRELLVRLGYRQAEWPEDYDLVLRILAGGHRIGTVPRRLMSWRERPGRLSRTDGRYGLERFTACKAAFLADGFLALHDGFVLWGYGDTGKALARALAAYGKHPTAIVDVHPGRIGQRIGGVPIIGPDAIPSLSGRPLVASVAGSGPRAEIRAYLSARGWRELRDFICTA
jgi:glycosyltransferase involved in cell wall biosynthesis